MDQQQPLVGLGSEQCHLLLSLWSLQKLKGCHTLVMVLLILDSGNYLNAWQNLSYKVFKLHWSKIVPVSGETQKS